MYSCCFGKNVVRFLLIVHSDVIIHPRGSGLLYVSPVLVPGSPWYHREHQFSLISAAQKVQNSRQ